MKKENAIILVVVAFIVGFIAGAVGGIKFYAGERGKGRPAASAETGPQAVDASDVQRLEGVVRDEPGNLAALIQLGNLYFDSNRYRQAIDTYTKALVLDPKDPNVRTDLGIMYRAVKDYDAAIREFREAARLDPKHRNSRFNLAIVLQNDKKDVPGAIAAWEDFLKIEPSGEQAAMARAQLEQLRGLAR